MGPSVLVIDDHLDTCRSLVRLLRLSGIQAECINNGADALSFLADCTPKVIFLDVMMPSMGGMEVLRAIRANKNCDTVAVIMYSAVSDVDQQREALELGAQAYVVKGTIDFDRLEKMIRRFTGQGDAPGRNLS